jgi:hypothetical protein
MAAHETSAGARTRGGGGTKERYRRAMRSPTFAARLATPRLAPARFATIGLGAARVGLATASLVLCLAACSEPRRAGPPKRPNTELIVGEYERHKPDGETAIRFRGDGSVRLAKLRAQLDTEPPLATGTWKLDASRLTVTYDKGMCTERAGDQTGVYTVVISKVGIHFTKVEDHCDRRSSIDGQTWWRIK